MRVVAQYTVYQVEQLGDHLRASITATRDDERELPMALLRVRLGIRPLQEGDDVVAQPGSVLERLQRERVLLQTWEAEVVRH